MTVSFTLTRNIVVTAHVHVCVFMSIHKASAVWISWNPRKQINNVILKAFISYAKFLHCYFKRKDLNFQLSPCIFFTHQKGAQPRINQCANCFQNTRPSFTIIRHCHHSAVHRKLICLWRLLSRQGSESNYERLKQLQTSALNPFYGKVLQKILLFCSNVVASHQQAPLADTLFEASHINSLTASRWVSLRGTTLVPIDKKGAYLFIKGIFER